MRLTGYAREYASLLVFFIRLLDAGMIFASGVICFRMLEPIKNFPYYAGLMPQNYLNAEGIAILLSAWWFPVFNVYRSWRGAGLYAEIRPLAAAWLASIVGLTAFIFFTKSADEFSRHWLGIWFLSAFVAMSISRLLIRLSLLKARRQGFNLRHIVLVGCAAKNAAVASKLKADSWLGLAVSGYFGNSDGAVNDSQCKKLGDLDELLPYLELNSVDQVWITLPLHEINSIEVLCQALEKVSVEVLLLPDISGWRLLNNSVTEVSGMPLINITASPMNGGNMLIKWLEDKVLSLLILLLTSPVLVLLALLVKLSSPGPALYRQERVSWNGKRFEMLKFRSMPVESDSCNGQPIWGHASGKRPTRLGKFLRQTSLDELPQFFNVLKGDMSIVGPRPERPIFVEQFKHEVDRYMQKHLVKAGITGWAQVNGWRGDTCLQTRVQHDLYYIEHWSLWFDLRIIAMTLFTGTGRNAY